MCTNTLSIPHLSAGTNLVAVTGSSHLMYWSSCLSHVVSTSTTVSLTSTTVTLSSRVTLVVLTLRRNKSKRNLSQPHSPCLLSHLYLNSYSYHLGRLKAVAQRKTMTDCTTPELRMLRKEQPPLPPTPMVLISRYLKGMYKMT